MRSRLLLALLALALGLGLVALLSRQRAGPAGRPDSEVAPVPGRGEIAALETDPAVAAPAEGAPPRAAEAGTPALPGSLPEEPLADPRLEGLVLRPDGKPAAEARVQFTQWRPDRAPDDQPEDSTLTDEDGRFTIDPAPIGRLQLVALHDDFAASEPLRLDLAAGEKKRDVRLELREYGRIRGVALDAHEVARPKLAITCEDLETRKALFTETDGAGRFEFPKVAAGAQLVSLEPPAAELAELRAEAPFLANMAERGDQARLVEVVAGATAEVVLGGIPAHGVRVFGRVTSGGAPAQRAWVWVEGGSLGWTSAPRTRVDERGEYELWVPAPSEDYTFHVCGAGGGLDLARPVPIRAEREQRVDFELPGGSLAGRVVDAAGHPIAEANVVIDVESTTEPQAQSEFSFWLPHCSTDAQGRFTFAGLKGGRYVLAATPLARPDEGTGLARTHTGTIELAAGAAIDGIEIVLKPGCSIRGTVHGQPEGRGRILYVRAYDESGRVIVGARADADGSFLLRGLEEGSYGLSAAGASLVSPVCAPVRVARDREPQVELTVAQGTQLVVLARCAGKEAPRELEISVLDARKNQIWSSSSSAPQFDFGWFVIAPGTYQVELSGPGGWSASETVVAGAGAETRVEVAVRRAK